MLVSLDVMLGEGTTYNLNGNITGEQGVLFTYRMYKALKENGVGPLFTDEELKKIKETRGLESGAFKPLKEGSIYKAVPSTEPVEVGQVSQVGLENGLKGINYARYLSGLPFDVEYSTALNTEAQMGAYVLMATNQFTHYPTNTVGMDSSAFKIGYDACSTSNIGDGYGDKVDALYRFNLSCVHDSDSNNMDKVGHRRWILNPNLKFVGMGLAQNKSVTKIFDTSRSPRLSPDYVTWPGAGPFPIRSSLDLDSLVWSISFSRDLGPISNGYVKLERLSDGRIWEFKTLGNVSGQGYFNMENGGYGYGPAMLFKPENIKIAHGQEYKVSFSLGRALGSTQGEYKVKFYN